LTAGVLAVDSHELQYLTETGGLQMHKHDAEGFFPERKTLRARRLPDMVDMPGDQSETLTQRVATWVSVSVAVFTPIFANAIVFGWMTVRLSLEIVLGAISFILVVAVALAAVNLRRAFRRANRPAS
jgi:hypothetical protein